jgi:DNA sulfur modification protein DndD
LKAKRDDLERRIASVPSADAVAPLIDAMETAEKRLLHAEAELIACESACEAAERKFAAARSRYQAELERHVKARLQKEDALRLAEHSTRVRETLSQFKAKVIRHHVHRIEQLILEIARRIVAEGRFSVRCPD